MKVDMAAKRRKKHKKQISEHVMSMCYSEQETKFWIFLNSSRLRF